MTELTPITLSNLQTIWLENDCAPPDPPLSFTRSFTETEDDCAPADRVRDLSQFLSIESAKKHRLMQLTPHLYTDSLPYDFTLAFSPYAPGGPVVLNPPAFIRLQEFGAPQTLEQAAAARCRHVTGRGMAHTGAGQPDPGQGEHKRIHQPHVRQLGAGTQRRGTFERLREPEATTT